MRYSREPDILTLIKSIWPLPDDEPEAAHPAIYQCLHELRCKIGSFRIGSAGWLGFALIQRQERRKVYATAKLGGTTGNPCAAQPESNRYKFRG